MQLHPTKNILVTGGAGYIGSHACKALHRAGYLPITCDNLVYGHPWAVKWGSLEQGDIADLAGLAHRALPAAGGDDCGLCLCR